MEEILQSLIEDGSKFALGCVKSILRGSPTSLKVMMESLRRAENLSYNECIRMEFRLWQRMPVSMMRSGAQKITILPPDNYSIFSIRMT